jgi:hypothetical protein
MGRPAFPGDHFDGGRFRHGRFRHGFVFFAGDYYDDRLGPRTIAASTCLSISAIASSKGRMDAKVASGQATCRSLIALLCTVSGVSDLAALLAEIGADISRFTAARAPADSPGRTKAPENRSHRA